MLSGRDLLIDQRQTSVGSCPFSKLPKKDYLAAGVGKDSHLANGRACQGSDEKRAGPYVQAFEALAGRFVKPSSAAGSPLGVMLDHHAAAKFLFEIVFQLLEQFDWHVIRTRRLGYRDCVETNIGKDDRPAVGADRAVIGGGAFYGRPFGHDAPGLELVGQKILAIEQDVEQRTVLKRQIIEARTEQIDLQAVEKVTIWSSEVPKIVGVRVKVLAVARLGAQIAETEVGIDIGAGASLAFSCGEVLPAE